MTTPPVACGTPLACWMRPEGSRFAFRRRRCTSRASEITARERETQMTLEEVAGSRTPLGPAATKPFTQVINEVSCSALMKPSETVLPKHDAAVSACLCFRQ